MRVSVSKLLLAAGLAFGVAHTASAARRDWSGLYVGGNAGYVDGSSHVRSGPVSTGGYFAGSSVPAIRSAGNGHLTPKGLNGGVQAGYNAQKKNIVLGFEADFDALPLNESRRVTKVYPCCAPSNFTVDELVSTKWMFSARPRIGYAVGDWLGYATLGVAVTRLNYENKFLDTFDAAFESHPVSEFRIGPTIGAGAEYAWGKRLSFRGEFLYTDFGFVNSGRNLKTTPNSPPEPVFVHSADLKTRSIRFAVNYRI